MNLPRSVARAAPGYARVALGAAFLSGIASRFGLWGKGVGYGSFEAFEQYTSEVNAFMPRVTIPFLAYAATAADSGSGSCWCWASGVGRWRSPPRPSF